MASPNLIQTDMDDFLKQFTALPTGYSTGLYEGRRWGMTKTVSDNGQRAKLYGEELGGNDHVSFNLYYLSDGSPRLKPCEMPEAKVVAFLAGYKVG